MKKKHLKFNHVRICISCTETEKVSVYGYCSQCVFKGTSKTIRCNCGQNILISNIRSGSGRNLGFDCYDETSVTCSCGCTWKGKYNYIKNSLEVRQIVEKIRKTRYEVISDE